MNHSRTCVALTSTSTAIVSPSVRRKSFTGVHAISRYAEERKSLVFIVVARWRYEVVDVVIVGEGADIYRIKKVLQRLEVAGHLAPWTWIIAKRLVPMSRGRIIHDYDTAT